MRKSPYRGRLTLVCVVVTTLMLTLLGRLWYLQVVTGPSYVKAATQSRVRSIVLPPVRGRILDVRGRPLAANETRPQVSVDYMALIHQPDGGKDVLTRLARALGRPYREIAERARLCARDVPRPCWPGSPYQPIIVADDVSVRTALSIAERHDEFPGVSTALRPVRTYPLGSAAAHVLGYLQPPSPGDPRGGPELVGRDGLEAEYDRELAGRTGIRQVAVDSTGKVTGLIREEAAVAGNTLVTSIDARIQKIAERALARAVTAARKRGEPADSGAAVVLEARTGRVTAIADYPTYDPGVWTGGISQREYEELPLAGAAVQGQWPPGSTWKVTSTAAAAKAGYSLRASYDCPGGYRIGGRVFHNFESAALGRMDMRRALVVSCDTIFYRFADEMWRRDGGLKPVKKIDASPKTLRFIRDALAGVPRTGTAAAAFEGYAFERLPIAGKTSTAEAYGKPRRRPRDRGPGRRRPLRRRRRGCRRIQARCSAQHPCLAAGAVGGLREGGVERRSTEPPQRRLTSARMD